MQFALIALLGIVLLILFGGLISMAKGGEFNRKWGNKLMQMRVAAQFLAVILIVLIVIVSGK